MFGKTSFQLVDTFKREMGLLQDLHDGLCGKEFVFSVRGKTEMVEVRSLLVDRFMSTVEYSMLSSTANLVCYCHA